MKLRLHTVVALLCLCSLLSGFDPQGRVDWGGVAITPYPVNGEGVELIEEHVSIDMPLVKDKLIIRSPGSKRKATLFFPERNMIRDDNKDLHTISELKIEFDGKPIEAKKIDGEAAPDEPGGDRWLHLISIELDADINYELLLTYSVEPSMDLSGDYLFEHLLCGGDWYETMQRFTLQVRIPRCTRVECCFPGIDIQRTCRETLLSAELLSPPEQDLSIIFGLVDTDILAKARAAQDLWLEYGCFQAIPEEQREGHNVDSFLYLLLLPSYLSGSWNMPELLPMFSDRYLSLLLKTGKALKGEQVLDPFFKDQYWYCPGNPATISPLPDNYDKLLNVIKSEESLRENYRH